MPVLKPIKAKAKITKPRPVDLSRRPPVQVSLGCHVHGLALPHGDPHDPYTMVAGVMKRFAFRPPDPDLAFMGELMEFAKTFCETYLTPLSPDSDTSVNHWLDSTNYPLWRKKELLAKYAMLTSILDPRGRYTECKSFMKDETYPEYKHVRAINSRKDEFKVFSGPIFKLIEQEVFKLKYFIKKIPAADRPAYITKMLGRNAAKYGCADYTAFESLFTAELMEVEFILYRYMVKHLPAGREWLSVVEPTLKGMNLCRFKHFSVKVPATRMSGEMNTSLGNGFTNLIILLFLAKKSGASNVDLVVEGDDSLATMDCPYPKQEMFTRLGLVVKAESHDDLESASFCGIIFDREDLVNVTDPKETLVSFGWTTSRYCKSGRRVLMKLLRCKALSLAHQYPGCPVISSLAYYGLRVTRGYDIRSFVQRNRTMSNWERDQILDALRDEKKIKRRIPPINTRLLVQKEFNITIEQQLRIEEELDAMQDVAPLHFDALHYISHPSWGHYWHNYVLYSDLGKNVDYPPSVWPIIKVLDASPPFS